MFPRAGRFVRLWRPRAEYFTSGFVHAMKNFLRPAITNGDRSITTFAGKVMAVLDLLNAGKRSLTAGRGRLNLSSEQQPETKPIQNA